MEKQLEGKVERLEGYITSLEDQADTLKDKVDTLQEKLDLLIANSTHTHSWETSTSKMRRVGRRSLKRKCRICAFKERNLDRGDFYEYDSSSDSD